jgi:hypothetical protein
VTTNANDLSGADSVQFGNADESLGVGCRRIYLVSETHSRSGNSTPFEIKLGLSEINEIWFPTTAKVSDGDQRQQLTITWNRVNETVEHRFALDDIANRYQIRIRNRR